MLETFFSLLLLDLSEIVEQEGLQDDGALSQVPAADEAHRLGPSNEGQDVVGVGVEDGRERGHEVQQRPDVKVPLIAKLESNL
jgi:hypothetical protein